MNDNEYFDVKDISEIDMGEWSSIAPNFTPEELRSNGDGSLFISKKALKALQSVRDKYMRPIKINSAYRDLSYNRSIGSTDKSQHTKGVAFDLHIPDQQSGRQLERIAVQCGFTGIGRYNSFIHIDMRPPKANGGGYRWGSWKEEELYV